MRFPGRLLRVLVFTAACLPGPAAWSLTCLVPVEGGDAAVTVWEIRPENEDPRFVGTQNGLFRIEGDRLVPVEGSDAAGNVWEIRPENEDPRFVGATLGLFRIVPLHDPVVENASGPVSVLRTSAHTFRWDVASECFEFVSGTFAVRLVGYPDQYPANSFPLLESETVRVEATVPIEAEDGGTVAALLQYRDSEAEDWRDLKNSQRTILVNWSAMDHAADWLARFGGWVAIGHALLFAGLLLAARRSARAWKILSDPVLNKAFLWFWFAMRHMPLLQRWPLGRWFEAVRARTDPTPHVPLPLTGPGQRTMSSADLTTEVGPRRRIWVQGNTGMGKTALVDHLAAQWFVGPAASSKKPWTLARAVGEYGYILMPIALRDHATVPVPEAPEDWLFDLAGRELARAGLPIADRQLLRGIVTSGSVVLVLDGANEVADGGAIHQFALRYPEVGLIVTSQNLPDTDTSHSFEVWRLPASIERAITPLLHVWLEKDRADAVVAAVEASPIRQDIRSGYDVRLLADLVDGGAAPEDLPEARMGLYEAMLARAKQSDGSAYPLPELCKVTWTAWVAGERQFVAGDTIPRTLLDPLLAPGVRIVRPAHDGRVEFRHDQMRGYLAARWAALHEVSPIDLFENAERIWRLARSEQQTVWGFFAEMIDSERGPRILEWATLQAERAELQVALRRVARRARWPSAESGLIDA